MSNKNLAVYLKEKPDSRVFKDAVKDEYDLFLASSRKQSLKTD